MDKFSRTTELDTAGVLNAIEEDTPKKSRRGNIIALIVCLVVAVVIWGHVMNTDTTVYEKDYVDIDIIVDSNEYTVTPKGTLSVVVKGTKSELVDIKRSEIKAVINSSQINREGEYKVPVTCYVEEDVDIEIKQSVTEILVKVESK